MNEHEIYPNAPVVLVALEVRHPTADPLTPSESRAIKKLLSDQLPIERPGQQMNVQIVPGSPNPAVMTTEHFPRFTNRETTLSVSIRKEAVVIEASDYPGWEDFRALALRALDARMQIAPIVGVERVGLRYIDEIRVPEAEPVDWTQWVNAALLGPAALAAPLGMAMVEHQAIARFALTEGRGLTVAYGPRQGYAVAPEPLVRSPLPAPSAFFLLDIDSSWTATSGIPEFDPEHILALSEELHDPVNALFELLITERLREEVLRHA